MIPHPTLEQWETITPEEITRVVATMRVENTRLVVGQIFLGLIAFGSFIAGCCAAPGSTSVTLAGIALVLVLAVVLTDARRTAVSESLNRYSELPDDACAAAVKVFESPDLVGYVDKVVALGRKLTWGEFQEAKALVQRRTEARQNQDACRTLYKSAWELPPY